MPKHIWGCGKGFTLVEVVLAVGIVSFALVGIIALLSVGLKSGKDATDIVDAAHAASQVLSGLDAPSTSQLPALTKNPPEVATKTFYIKRSGESASGSNDPGAAYRVDSRVQQVALHQPGVATIWVRLTWPPAAEDKGSSFDVVTAALTEPAP